MPPWNRYEELRPDQLEQLVKQSPVAYWPLGLLEHHGWHLPIGFDGIKADRMCQRMADATGGLLLPTMWWGGGGGHDVFKWSHYQSEAATGAILTDTLEQLLDFGFEVIVLLAGHYPWQSLLEKHLPALEEAHPNRLLLWGTEVTISKGAVPLAGDHAALEETSFGLALFPELVDMDALRPGRDQSAWPQNQPPPIEKQHPNVNFDPADPLFAQMGADSRQASAERGEAGTAALVAHLTKVIKDRLAGR